MNLMKTITAAVVLSASIVAPAFAQEAYRSYGSAPYQPAPQTYYRSYDAPRNNDQYWHQQNFGFSGRNPSRVGGVSPNLNPPS
jgi:hypothetical protein